jgi:hypothetical protein
MKLFPRCWIVVVGVALAITLNGCATSGGRPTYTKTLQPESRITASDRVSVEIVPGPEVKIAKYERERFEQTIESTIRSHAGVSGHGARDYKIVVTINKYEKGSAFARAMLAGLGQMHIDAAVAVYQMPGRKLVGEFKMDKTFSWGGVYGASANIETVEEDFAKSLAETACAPKPGAAKRGE